MGVDTSEGGPPTQPTDSGFTAADATVTPDADAAPPPPPPTFDGGVYAIVFVTKKAVAGDIHPGTGSGVAPAHVLCQTCRGLDGPDRRGLGFDR